MSFSGHSQRKIANTHNVKVIPRAFCFSIGKNELFFLESEPAERQNRCTCTYCELFAVPKIVDPRAKLRMRAHRRKDKKYEGDSFKPISSLTNGNNNNNTNTPKTENRVSVHNK